MFMSKFMKNAFDKSAKNHEGVKLLFACALVILITFAIAFGGLCFCGLILWGLWSWIAVGIFGLPAFGFWTWVLVSLALSIIKNMFCRKQKTP